MGLQRELLPQPLPSFVFGACCRNLAYGRHHTPRKGCVGAKGQLWFSGSWAGQYLEAMANACLPRSCLTPPVSCCFVAGLLCDLFLKWKLFLGCSKLSEASALCLP